MDNYRAIGLAEGFIESDNNEEVLAAWQHLVDTGICWNLQGWFGRNAMRLIESGDIKPPNKKRTKNVRDK